MAGEGAATNRLDVLKASFWPLLVAVAMILFAGPLSRLVTAVATNAGPAQEIELGPIKLKLSARAAAAIEPPSNEVATALAKLSDAEKEQLISRQENGLNQVCLPGGFANPGTSSSGANSSELRFIELKLTSFADRPRAPSDTESWCKFDSTRWAVFTELGRKVRRYLVDISLKAVQITKS